MERLFQLLQAGIESTGSRSDELLQLPLFGSPHITKRTFEFLAHMIDFLLGFGTLTLFRRLVLLVPYSNSNPLFFGANWRSSAPFDSLEPFSVVLTSFAWLDARISSNFQVHKSKASFESPARESSSRSSRLTSIEVRSSSLLLHVKTFLVESLNGLFSCVREWRLTFASTCAPTEASLPDADFTRLGWKKGHVSEVASLFKLFFREMPDSLLTHELYDCFISVYGTLLTH